MHSLLKRQLKKINYKKNSFDQKKLEKFIDIVDQAYYDNDNDRELLEHTLNISSKEMQGLYEELKQKSQVELTHSNEKYSRLVENLRNYYFFYTHNTDGIFTSLSNSITTILGYSVEEFLTHYKTYLTNDPMNDDITKYTNRTLLGVQQAPYKLSIYHKDGTIRYLEVTELAIFNEDGEVILVDGIAKDISKQYQIEQKISHLAKHDTLTGLANRMYLEEQLQDLISNSNRQDSSFALLFLDLDRFKQINDTLGHNIGDKLLQNVAKRIKPNIRHEDVFARLGGDEFLIILTNIQNGHLTTIINKIIKLMRKTWIIDAYELKVSTSMGIALYPQDGETMIELMKNADIAMYRAKELGRDNFSFFTDELNEKVHFDMKLEQEMANALSTNQFILYYQPKQKLIDDKIIGAEALIRWKHPELGLIYPKNFIPLAESTGFIIKLGHWIIEEGCRAISRFNKKDSNQLLHLSINLSIRQLQHNNLCKTIKKALLTNNINPLQLSIEITESIMIENSDKMIKKLQEIRALGVKICMDDFGTGFSSLSYLSRLPINTLKIDKLFVDEIQRDGDKKIILDTIIAMGKALDIEVLAEGVEKEYQRKYLLEKGCIYYQGHLFCKAIPENEYISLLD